MKANSLIRIITIYLLLSAFICAFYLLLLVITQELNTLGAVLSVIVPSLLVAITFFNSINVLVSKSNLVLIRGTTINGIILAIQTITVFTEGFYYRYTQGSNLFFFISIERSTKAVLWDIYLELAVLDFDLKFAPSEYTLIGVNMMALGLAIVSFLMAKQLELGTNSLKTPD